MLIKRLRVAVLTLAVATSSPAFSADCECLSADFLDDSTWITSTSYNILTGWTVNFATEFYLDCFYSSQSNDCKAVWYGELWQGTHPLFTAFVTQTAQSTTPALECNTLHTVRVGHSASNLWSDLYYDIRVYVKCPDSSFWDTDTISFHTFSDPGDQ